MSTLAMGGRWLVLVVTAAVAGSGCWAAQAGAYVYWADAAGAIGRANLDGSLANKSFISDPSDAPAGVSVDGEHIYWTNDGGTIERANLDGSGVNQNFIAGANGPSGIAVDGRHIYWANGGDGTIGRANLDGSGVDQGFITGANSPSGVAVDGEHIYWTNSGNDTIGRANLDGSGIDQSFITGANGPAGVAVDGGHIYWTNAGNGTIGRANLDGSGVDQSLLTGGNVLTSIAVDGQHIYWGDSGQNAVGRANLDGSAANGNFIINAAQPFGVAVDGGPAGSATPSQASLSLPAQPLDTYGAPQPLTITNTGHGVLQIDRAQVTSGSVDDFLISTDTCSGASIRIGGTCTIDVSFGPSATGARSATLTVTSNDTAGPLVIALAGVGDPMPSRSPGPPGPPGTSGPIGGGGPKGLTGAMGATGLAGKNGKNGVVELITCRNVRRTIVKKVRGKRKRVKVTRQVCTTKIVTRPTRFTIASVRHAVLTHAGITDARGTQLHDGRRPQLLVSGARSLHSGHYTLTLSWTDRHHHRHMSERGITVTVGRGISNG